jgi:hypothetical protein
MKKIFIGAALILFAATGFSQVLKPVKIDSLVTISLPPDHDEKDTLGQHIYSGNGLTGFMEVIKAANVVNTKPLQNQKDLNKVFNDYINILQSQSDNGSTQNIRDTVIGTLKAKLFTLREEEENQVQLRNFILIYTTEATYTIEYAYPEFRAGLIGDEYNAYVKSLKFTKDLQRNDQYLFNVTGMSAKAKLGLYGGIALVIIVVIILIIRRRKKRSR